MGSKKHKKHHRSEKKEAKEGIKSNERQEKPLKLVLKVGGSSSSVQAPESPSSSAPTPADIQQPVLPKSSTSGEALGQLSSQPASIGTPPQAVFDPLLKPKEEKPDTSDLHHSHEKHKKSKKKKKKKSSERDKDSKHQKRHKHHHHHHHHREHSHERKEKRRREHDHDHGAKEPPTKRQLVETVALCDRPIRDPRTCTLNLKKKSTKTPLQMLLCYLMKNFQKKDPQQFFAWPVSDVIAPGYSSIIGHPMDFNSMKQKIDAKDYSCLADFKNDLKLMCDNAMVYNRPDTIYYKAAKKMWHGQKLFNKEQLMSLSRNLPFILEMPPEELGFDPKEHMEETVQLEEGGGEDELPLPSPEAKKSKHKSKHSEEKIFIPAFSDEDEDLALDEILIQAQKAAKGAADRLTLEKPNSNYAFLRQRDDGTTTLAILNQDGAKAEESEVNLEMLVGKLNHGGGSICGFKEDPKNVVRPVKSLNYGSFCSYAPQYDSMFSNLTKEESCLVLSTYGDELGVQYAESLLSFAKDCDYVMTMVDNMLDALTGGTHSKTIKQLEERRKLAKEELAKKEAAAAALQESSTDMNLSDLDMDFLNSSDEDPKTGGKLGLQQKLDETSGLLQDLAKVQNERLSSTPPSHLSNIQGANASEIELADKVTRSLTELAIQVTPGSVVGLQSIRKAMGIGYHPVQSPIVSHQSPSIEEDLLDKSVDSSANQKQIEQNRLEGLNPSDKNEALECDLQEFLDSTSVLQACDSSSM